MKALRPGRRPAPLRAFLSAVLLLLCAGAVGRGESTDMAIWPPAPLLPEANPAAVSRPRFEWLDRVQSKIDETRGKSYALVFDGDSITDFWPSNGKASWDALCAGRQVVNFAIGGDRIENLLWRLNHGQAEGLHPRLIVLLIGTNNLSTCTDAQIVQGIGVVVAAYCRRCPESRLLLLGIFPRDNPPNPVRERIVAINRKLARLADGKQVTYLDIGSKFLTSDGLLTHEIMPDALHPAAEGYRIWAEAIQPIIDGYVPVSAPAPAR